MNELLTVTLTGLASRLGAFERSLLISVRNAGDDAYCAALSRRLSEELGRDVTMGQVSRTLGALKRLGLLISEQRFPATPTKHQRHRLVFKLTAGGIAAAETLNPHRRLPIGAARLNEAPAQ